METVTKKKLYEAMFLVDSALAASDWEGTNAAIERIIERAEAEIVSKEKWDERKLAYEIRGKARGTYILCYFNASGNKIHQIERDVQLSENIMRVLILRADHVTPGDIEKESPVITAEKQKELQPVIAAEKDTEQESFKEDEDLKDQKQDEKEKQPEDEVHDDTKENRQE